MPLNATLWITALQRLQDRLCTAVAFFGEAGYHRCWHPELSPAGWHLAHCVYVEDYWLRQAAVVPGVPGERARAAWMPGSLAKPERGALLPPLETLLRGAAARQVCHRRLLGHISTASRRTHPLLQGHYLARFLVQHHAMHLESLALVKAQRALRQKAPWSPAACVPRPQCPHPAHSHCLPAGRYVIGSTTEWVPFDNEFAAHEVDLAAVRIACRPLSCAEYLAFMAEGGYRNREYWSREGWEWRCRNACEAPSYWRRDATGHWRWCGDELPGAAERPVWGISYYEAGACAAWAGGRLPHEYEWEASRRLKILEGSGRIWEWCANPLHPYPGFKAYPYTGYSTPWFDGKHYVLRGGSLFSGRQLRRPGFRNFYLPGHRHLYAGLRLVYDSVLRQGA